MKRFTVIISLLLLTAAPSLACMWEETHNYYLFSVYNRSEFSQRMDDISRNNWKVYLGKIGDETYYFNADEIIKFARQKDDQLMVGYVEGLKDYLECVRSKEREQWAWDYPTQDEIAQRNRTLNRLRTYAQSKLGTRLRSQHALLFMRCNMMLGRHGENITFWEQTASQYIETVYKDMMQNIYAGALLKTGRLDRAGQIFAQQGDWQSLMTQYYKKRSYQAIRQEYLRDPKSAVLPFLLQDFVNNAQEATDVDNPMAGGMDGKLFIRNIQRQEAQQMIQLCAQAVRESKTDVPCLWMSAKAWLEYMYGNHRQALTDINEAKRLDGTERMKANARVLHIYITSMQATPNPQFDTYIAGELQWLDLMADGDYHYRNAKDRIVHQALEPRYSANGQQNTGFSLLRAAHASKCYEYIDTMSVDHLLSYIDYAKSPAQNPLDRYLKPLQDIDDNQMNDLIGTKYMRLCQWSAAQPWLQKVPVRFYGERGYVAYAANRSYTVEPWITRQWLTDEQQWNDSPSQLTRNPKLEFAREMEKMEKDLNRLSGKTRQQRCYDLAVRYAQASFTGDCWYLMRDSKSINDWVRPNETDLAARAVELLREASLSNDFKLKERALFALAYCYLNNDSWYERQWNSATADYDRIPQRSTAHYSAWATLATLERANAGRTSDYVTRCDEYKQFLKVFGR